MQHHPVFDDLAAYRASENMPPNTYPNNTHTAARLDIDGQTFYGRNAHHLPLDMGKLNSYTRDHAEAHVFQQAKNAGATGKTAVLYVDNAFCRPCEKGGVGSLMRATGVDEILAVTPEGSFTITASRPSVPHAAALDSPKAEAILQTERDLAAKRQVSPATPPTDAPTKGLSAAEYARFLHSQIENSPDPEATAIVAHMFDSIARWGPESEPAVTHPGPDIPDVEPAVGPDHPYVQYADQLHELIPHSPDPEATRAAEGFMRQWPTANDAVHKSPSQGPKAKPSSKAAQPSKTLRRSSGPRR